MKDFYFLGAIIGDVIGSKYEFNNHRSKKFKLFDKDMFFTDDTVLTIATMDGLLHDIEPVKVYQKWGRKYPNVSWGASFNYWLHIDNPSPYYSFGNGSAMRISPVGWFAKSEKEVKKLSYKYTAVSHNHPEGIKGAYVIAMCIYMARNGKTKEEIKKFAEKHYDLDFNYKELKNYYYFNESCQETVPQAIYCFLISNDFEDTIRTSVSIGGDTDTLCAISGAIASAYYGIPIKIIKQISRYLNDDMLLLVQEFNRTTNANETK